MPESVRDRCTKAHEYVFLLSKSARYYYDAEAIAEAATWQPGMAEDRPRGYFNGKHDQEGSQTAGAFRAIRETRNRRSVWTITTKPYPEAHFATYPPELVTPCILAGCPAGGIVLDPFAGSGTTIAVAIENGCRGIGIELNPEYVKLANRLMNTERPLFAEAAND